MIMMNIFWLSLFLLLCFKFWIVFYFADNIRIYQIYSTDYYILYIIKFLLFNIYLLVWIYLTLTLIDLCYEL